MSPIPVSNLDQAEAWEASGGILPPGKHNVSIADVDDSQPSSGGHPQIALQLEAADGLQIRDWIVVIPSTYGKVVQLLKAAGVPIPSGDTVFDPGVLKGRKVLITVAEEPNNRGEQRSKVKAYEPSGQSDIPGGVPGVTYGSGSSAVNDDIPF